MRAVSPTRPDWRFLLAPRWLGWHAVMVVSFWGMLWLGDWQLHRAMSGNPLSWAYTFEWPLFAGFAVVFWARTIRDEFRLRRDGTYGEHEAEPELPASASLNRAGMIQGAATAAAVAQAEAEDPELSAYNAYLARLNAEAEGHGARPGPR